MSPPSPSRPARARRLLVCGFGAFPGFAQNPAEGVVERLQAQGWRPGDAEADYAVLPTTWTGAVETAAERMRENGAAAVLLVGVASGAQAFRIEMRARNRAAVARPDALGALHPRPRIWPDGPAVVRSAAPIQAMVQAILDEGLPAEASSDAGDYLCNYTFYRLQAEVAVNAGAPPVAFLHLPPNLSSEALERGVKAAAGALARGVTAGPDLVEA